MLFHVEDGSTPGRTKSTAMSKRTRKVEKASIIGFVRNEILVNHREIIRLNWFYSHLPCFSAAWREDNMVSSCKSQEKASWLRSVWNEVRSNIKTKQTRHRYSRLNTELVNKWFFFREGWLSVWEVLAVQITFATHTMLMMAKKLISKRLAVFLGEHYLKSSFIDILKCRCERIQTTARTGHPSTTFCHVKQSLLPDV